MALQRYHADGEGNAREIVQKLRPVPGAYCKNTAQTLFVAADTLGVMVGKITANATHPLAGVVDQLDEINVYSRRYHHGETPVLFQGGLLFFESTGTLLGVPR